MVPRTADELRRAFVAFFEERGHTVVPSASLIPHDPTVLFTVAGMVPFKPYFVGDEPAPYDRAVSVQKCLRAGGKHNDLDEVGRSTRHNTFFEMLGNFSFGDYFKADAIAYAWEFLTGVLGLDPERLWVTVHVSDDEAAHVWADAVGVDPSRIQRLEDDNFWRMGDTGPCGPSSEIFWDKGERFGPPGGPAEGGEDRFVELWNLVFMQFDQRPDGTRVDLPRPSIDTGAGLERNLAVLQGVDSIFEIDVFAPIIAAAEDATGATMGASDTGDVSLRILAEHARAMTFLVADGVVPSNEERGYVLRRIIRRAVRHAFLLGADSVVTPRLVDATVEVMGGAYPELVAKRDDVAQTVGREEDRFLTTLRRGLDLLDGVLADGDVSAADAFHLHDTLGFPLELTQEIAAERHRSVDVDGFEDLMEEQRARAQSAQRTVAGDDGAAPVFRSLLDEHGETEFTGRGEYTSKATVVGIVSGAAAVERLDAGESGRVVLDRTPFYAESGGQVGDTGTITSSDGARARVDDTQYALPGALTAHDVVVEEGALSVGDDVEAAIDGTRRDRIRRNHTATHILHWALREVLGPQTRQAGSLVAPDRLRFDFSHHQAPTPDELAEVERLANEEVITNAAVRHYETTMDHAREIGAVAFFGDKYGDVVRVLEAGDHSTELCGGTHVHALGFIGPIKIVNEGSVGSNLRRIEALTGGAAFDHIRGEEAVLRDAAGFLKTSPDDVPAGVRRLVDTNKELRAEVATLRAAQAGADARALATDAVEGRVVTRRDGLGPDDLRRLASETLRELGSGVVALVGEADGKAAIAVALSEDLREAGASAAEIAAPAARCLGGGTARNADLVAGGGPTTDGIPDALDRLAEEAAAATSALAGS
ncbi:MAG: alanine--tRNA ligase [Acidimicrobiia bacterium]